MDPSKLLATGEYYFPTQEGYWVSEKQRRVAEILHDYNSELELQFVPPGERDSQDMAFRVVHRPIGRPAYAILYAHEADERLLGRVFAADQRKHNALEVLDQINNAVELLEAKKRQEQLDEAHELAWGIWNSNKYHYRHKGKDFGRIDDRKAR